MHRSERYVYNESDKLIQRFESDHNGTESTTFEYDSRGNQIGWTRRNASRALISQGIEEYVGSLLVSLASFRAGKVPSHQKTFEYVEGRLSRAVSEYFDSSGDLAERWI
jgi:YD repeat-containing protein